MALSDNPIQFVDNVIACISRTCFAVACETQRFEDLPK